MQISEDSVFGPGSDLWILPERKNSQIAQKLDWYLNFQISKAVHHETKNLAQPILEVLKNCQLESYDWAPTDTEALLILSSQNLPNRWVMVIRGSERLETWAETAAEKWRKLKSPSVRVFLPQEISIAEFEKLWKKSGGDPNSLTIVADKEDSLHG
ncbi:MAG: hypothetical protein ACAH59_06520 [Pseudobdellovibrionaceae bacterium]